jgi:hypothetical protein
MEKNKKQKCVWCNDCGGGSIYKAGWGHKKGARHDVISLKDAGKYDEALREFLFIKRGGKPTQEALVSQKQQAEAGKSRAVPEPALYAFDFGKHKRKSIANLYTSGQKQLAEYIPWLFA